MDKVKVLLLLSLLLFRLSSNVHAQKYTTISGHVRSSKTNEPMYMANVFLGDTNLGSAVDKNGDFEIINITPGEYTLFITMIGYRKYQQAVDLRVENVHDLVIYLHDEVLLGKTIMVEAEEPVVWKRNLIKFKNAILGISQFKNQVEFINPEVLSFEVKDGSLPNLEVLTATTCQSLILINHALGYKIEYEIEKFEVDLRAGKLFYIDEFVQQLGAHIIIGRRKLTPLKAENDGQYVKWEKNRNTVYQGSFRHFLWSLAHGCSKEHGFEIRSVSNVVLSTPGSKIEPDSILDKEPNSEIISLDLVDKELEDDKGCFYVLQIKGTGTSILYVPLISTLKFNTNGSVLSSPDFYFGGYWAWNRSAAHWLPEDYFHTFDGEN